MLAFVARRIEADAITILVTSRETIPRALRGLPSRTLAPLTSDAAEALLHGLDGDLAPATRARILEQAQGNPLGLVELLASSTRAEQEPELPTWLPLSTRLERTFSARVADLPETTRAALLVAALTDRADVTEVLAAASVLAETPLTLDVLTPAVQAGLIEVGELRIAFGHPLMRSAIGQGGSESRRRAAHEALAATLGPALSLGHRVAAAAGADDTLADELAGLAHLARRRGSMVRAAETLGRAAALTADEHVRGARLLDAAELALDVGREDLVERLLGEAAPLLLAPDDHQRRIWLQRTASRRAPSPAWFEAHLDRVEELIAANDPARASQALLTVVFRAWWSDVPDALRERMIADVRALPPETPEAIAVMALALVAPAEYGPEVRGVARADGPGRAARRDAAARGRDVRDRRGVRPGVDDRGPRAGTAAGARALRAAGDGVGGSGVDGRVRRLVDRVAGRGAGGRGGRARDEPAVVDRRGACGRSGVGRGARGRCACAGVGRRGRAAAPARRGRGDALDGRARPRAGAGGSGLRRWRTSSACWT